MVVQGVMGTPLPCVASHEGTGTVIALGSSAISSFNRGDRIMAGLPRDRCGTCSDCLGPEDYRQYCAKAKGYVGVTLDGAFAEYMIVDGRESVKLPDKVDFETAAPLACAGVTVWRGVLQAGLNKGETICIVGAGGGLGHLGVQFARALGLVVVGVEARGEGLELAKRCGADVVVDARKPKEEVIKSVQKVTQGAGADATVNVSDDESAAGLACAVTKMHGTMVQIAQPSEVSIPFAELIFRDVRVRGSLISTREEAQRMLDMVAKFGIRVNTNPFYGLEEIPKLLELAHSGKMKGKGVVIIDEEEMRREKERINGG